MLFLLGEEMGAIANREFNLVLSYQKPKERYVLKSLLLHIGVHMACNIFQKKRI